MGEKKKKQRGESNRQRLILVFVFFTDLWCRLVLWKKAPQNPKGLVEGSGEGEKKLLEEGFRQKRAFTADKEHLSTQQTTQQESKGSGDLERGRKEREHLRTEDSFRSSVIKTSTFAFSTWEGGLPDGRLKQRRKKNKKGTRITRGHQTWLMRPFAGNPQLMRGVLWSTGEKS